MGWKRRLCDAFIQTVNRILFLNQANKFSCYFAERLAPIYEITKDNEKYFFYCPNLLTRWRAETFLTKEPETIQWINTFKKDEVLFDIGANIGQYSIYAAKRNVRVVAFEPESQNYAILNRNIYLNQSQDRILALNIALSNKDSLDYLYMPVFQTGSAFNSFGIALNEDKKAVNTVFKQGAISYSLDSFLEKYPQYFPNHIKVDVDGLEADIIKGAGTVLADSRVKSLCIELNESLLEDRALIDFLRSKDLEFVSKKSYSLTDGVFYYLFVRK